MIGIIFPIRRSPLPYSDAHLPLQLRPVPGVQSSHGDLLQGNIAVLKEQVPQIRPCRCPQFQHYRPYLPMISPHRLRLR
jgi:hypothetical protein